MKKICLIGPAAPYRGGIAQHLTLFDKHLREAGFDVLLVSFRRQYPRLLFGRSDVDPASQPYHNQTEYLIDSLNPVSWRSAAKRIGDWRPDVVIIPWWTPFWAPVWTSMAKNIKRRCPQSRLIFLCHNVLPHESRFFDKAALRIALRRADGFVVHAEAERPKLERFFPKSSILVSPHPTYAQIGRAASLHDFQRPSAENIILFCGIVRYYKGLDILLKALALLETKVHLYVVGDFWEDAAVYEQQVAEFGLTAQVTIVNQYVPDDVLAGYVRLADVVVLPYRNATQSGVAQLALGHGTPVITTDVGGLAEVVSHKHTGLVIPPQNPKELAKAIDYFFANPDQIEFVANIKRDQKRFSWRTFVGNVNRFVKEMD
ncbi:MAG: glycosyltransferase [Chloroflexota bacterium]